MPSSRPWLGLPYPLGSGKSNGGTEFTVEAVSGTKLYIGVCSCGWRSAPRKGGWPFGTHFVMAHGERSRNRDRQENEAIENGKSHKPLSSNQLSELAQIVADAQKDKAEAERLREILTTIRELLEDV